MRGAVFARFAEGSGESIALDQGLVLSSDREKRRPLHFFPEVKAGLIPVLRDISQVILNDRPDVRECQGLLVLRYQVIAIGDESRCAQCRAVALGASPGSGEGGHVDVEFWFGEAEAIGEVAGGVGDGLEGCLGGDVGLDCWFESCVAGYETLD